MTKSIFKLIIVFSTVSLLFAQCNQESKSNSDIEEQSVQIRCKTNNGSYKLGKMVSLSLELHNPTSKQIKVDSIVATIKNISTKEEAHISKITLAEIVKLKPQKSFNIGEKEIFRITKNLPFDAYGIFIDLFLRNSKKQSSYQTFFRVVDDQMLTCFEIEKENYIGLDIFTLDGGMSAEYVVEKAAECISGGISHSWEVNAPGSGPNHVYATPQFLEKSVNQTVDFYNSALGNDKVFETVIISTGFPSVPYISNALKAPVLPLHFLVSANSVKEVQSILDYSNHNNFKSYATLSHDPSVPYAVAWVKLIDTPQPYIDFIKQHKVKNVIIMGSTGTKDGETKAKKIITSESKDGYNPGDIYIMFPGTSPDDKTTLSEKIIDLEKHTLQEDFNRIADWESGITDEQLTNFSKSVKDAISSTEVAKITAPDLIHLYNLGTYITVAYMHKNIKSFQDFNLIKGVVFNPYLLSHPVYEMKHGYIPVVYWQLIPPAWTLGRLENDMTKFIDSYFSGTGYKMLNYWVNSSRNFGGSWSAENLKNTLIEKGYKNIKTNDYSKDETWNPEDGMEAISERIVKEITDSKSVENFKKWNDGLTPISLQDLQKIISETEGITITIN